MGEGEKLSWEEGEAFDFTISDAFAQWLNISVFREDSSPLLGTWQGDCFGQVSMFMSNLLEEASREKWSFWINFGTAAEASPGSWPMIEHADSKPYSPGGICVRLQIEFRLLTSNVTQAQALHRGSSSYDLWKLKNSMYKDCSEDVACQVHLCLHTLHDLPFEEDRNRKYWCVVTKHCEVEGREKREELHSKKAAGKFTNHFDKGYSKVSDASFMQTLVFSVCCPERTSITIEVKSAVGKATPETIGSVTQRIKSVLLCTNLVKEFDSDLGKSGCKLLRTMLKVYMVGEMEHTYAERPAWSED